ncbi:hypothetical protein IVB34_47850 [Bradyrhizobium sp. 2]|uniref:hypothetical protein n=1 Tax=Bradyrhizobium sp. 2 TaxID=190045 RepID=UPI001FF755A6|nr:hypothetical protein [Bradyrhizobium sp. 2]MCK1465803.1 hypothetical protein [Bradyrhizobium sp. 2]
MLVEAVDESSGFSFIPGHDCHHPELCEYSMGGAFRFGMLAEVGKALRSQHLNVAIGEVFVSTLFAPFQMRLTVHFSSPVFQADVE